MIKEEIEKDLRVAQKQKDELCVSTLRLALAAIHNQEIEKQDQLTDEEVTGVLRTQVKQRRESIDAFKKGKRDELVRKEEEELKILSKYLPHEIPQKELVKIIDETIAATDASGAPDFGKVMAQVMGKVKGRAEGSQVVELVKKRLSPRP